MKTGFSLLEKLHKENPVFVTGMGLHRTDVVAIVATLSAKNWPWRPCSEMVDIIVLKFIFSKKATKIDEIFPVDLTLTHR
jgi:hypothetical protein